MHLKKVAAAFEYTVYKFNRMYTTKCMDLSQTVINKFVVYLDLSPIFLGVFTQRHIEQISTIHTILKDLLF